VRFGTLFKGAGDPWSACAGPRSENSAAALPRAMRREVGDGSDVRGPPVSGSGAMQRGLPSGTRMAAAVRGGWRACAAAGPRPKGGCARRGGGGRWAEGGVAGLGRGKTLFFL